ncbi:MAG TPA: hypothetical protein VMO47_10600 [Rhodothermales bacterium]|nr:hypothetical protein [Rhodothermales bacterium]
MSMVRASMSADRVSPQLAFDDLHRYLVEKNFTGWEYDDLLASPFVNSLTRFGLYPRIAAVQLAKRCPINLRPFLGVPRLQSTKAWGFIVKGYLYNYLATDDDRYLPLVRRGLDWLIENRSPGRVEFCWGNDFDFASRSGFFPKRLPTVVWTSHIQAAFDLAWDTLGDPRYRDVVISSARFVETDLERNGDDTGICFAYAPGVNCVVHNSNLLGAVALLRGWRHTGNEDHYELARTAINWSLTRMNPDGSWYYGDRGMQHWIDNYHTGYNLDSLVLARVLTQGNLVKQTDINKTYVFWRDHFFESTGAPKFYHDRVYPHDIQATAQAIESLSKYSVYDRDALALAKKVFDWAIRSMGKENGSFRYRIYRHWTNHLEAIHWGQATMLSAIGHLLYYTKRSESMANAASQVSLQNKTDYQPAT